MTETLQDLRPSTAASFFDEQTNFVPTSLPPCQPQALHESAAAAKERSDALSASSATPPKPLPTPVIADPPQPAAWEPVVAPPPPLQEEIQVLSPVDYDVLVSRAVSQEKAGLSELRRKAGDAGVVRHSNIICFSVMQYTALSILLLEVTLQGCARSCFN